MPEIDPVILQLRADVAKYNADVQQTARRVTAHLDRQEQSVISLENQFRRSSSGIASSLGSISRVTNAFGAALGGISVAALARGFLQVADASKNLDAQLRLATQASGSFGKAQDDVRRIATETRSGLKETADLYATFMRNSRELGITQEQAARSTETITKAFTISGASAAEAAGGLRQFLQGIQSGTLRGEELNSVLENAPRLARALADGLGITIGQLRAMGQEGELTGQKVIGALESAATSIDAEFRELPVTFDQAMTLVYNAALTTFGAFDQGGEFSSMLANFVTDGAQGFSGLQSSAEQFGRNTRAELEGLAAAFGPVISQMSELLNLFGVASSQGPLFKTLTGEIDAIRNWSIDIENNFTRGMNNFKAGLNEAQRRAGNTDPNKQSRMTPLQERSNFQGRYLDDYNSTQRNSVSRAGERALRDSFRRRDAMGNLIDAGPTPSAPASSSGGRKKAVGRTPRSPLNPEVFAREEAQLNDQILRLKADEITNADERAMAELKRLEAANLAATTEVQADKRYTDAQKTKIIALMGTANALQQAKVLAERDLIATRDALHIRMSGLRDQQDLLRNDADLSETREERRDVELRLLDLAYQMERAELEALISSKDASAAQKEIAESRLRILGALQAGEAEGINRRNESPLARRRREVRETTANMGDEMEDIQLDALDRLTDGLADASTEYLKLGGVAGDVINGIIRDLVRLAAQQAIFGTGGGGGILNNIGSFLGIGGSVTGAGGAKSIANFKGARATGGPVMAGGTYLVGEEGPELFTAPRSGSIVPNHAINTTAAASMTGLAATARAAPTVVTQVMKFDLSGAVVTEQLLQQMNQMAQSAGIAGAAAGSNQAQAAIMQRGRRRIPGR